MLFAARFREGLERGEINLTIRAWSRPQAKTGGRYVTSAGMIAVEAVDLVPLADVTDDDARRCGFPDRAALLKEMGKPLPENVYRLAIRFDGDDDRPPVGVDDQLSEDDVERITKRLARLDMNAADGPWTGATLDIIERRPATRAADLAAELGRERLPFKADVRKLKAIGLTQSLEKGYRLSPGGRAYLDRLRKP